MFFNNFNPKKSYSNEKKIALLSLKKVSQCKNINGPKIFFIFLC